MFSLWNPTPSDPHDDPTIKSVISAFLADRFSREFTKPAGYLKVR
jgi:hypothetical protein